jgi:hypothetical protein
MHSRHQHHTASQLRQQAVKTNSLLLPLLLKRMVEILQSVLQTFAAIILVLSLLLKCCLPTTLYKHTNSCSLHLQTNRQTNKLLSDECDFTEITAAIHTRNEKMSSSWVVRGVPD